MSKSMRVRRHLATLGLSALALLTMSLPAHADLASNGSFENIGAATSSFSLNLDGVLTDWAATPSGNHILDCLVIAGATNNLCGTAAFGGGMKFWSNPGPSPDGGNFVGSDGDQNYSTPISQTITGLVLGASYDVSFYQAAAQQSGFDGVTTERWQVSLDGDSQLSTLMNNANHGSVGWMSQTLTFTASAASQTLSFLAVGTPNGQPPFVLLDGVSVAATAPEPESFALLGMGLLCLPLARKLIKRRV